MLHIATSEVPVRDRGSLAEQRAELAGRRGRDHVTHRMLDTARLRSSLLPCTAQTYKISRSDM